jgi:SMODS and SLOG-associating 2TM effector domain 3/SMODS and SLOG-associating 2TM effector domain 1
MGEGLSGAGRIAVELRVGVTGHRWLDPSDVSLVEVVGDALTRVRAACTASSTDATPVGLTVVSSLAEGADRIVAQAALAMGARLEVVLPLAEADFRADFADERSAGEFTALLERAASVTVVPGDPERPEAYGAAGRMVLHRSDVLLAMWDGAPARGEGGTGALVETAQAAGKACCWIKVANRTPAHAVIAAVPDSVVLLEPAAFAGLDWYNRQRVALGDSRGLPEGYPQSGPVAHWALPYFRRADRLATRLQRRFRMISRALYVLSVVAIGVSALQITFFPEHPSVAWAELAALLLILGLLAWSRRSRLLQRWLAVRFFAERIRSLAFLVELTDEGALKTATPEDEDDGPVNEWMRRAISELWIQAPRKEVAPADLLAQSRVRLADEWVLPQVAYHRATSRRSDHLRHVFGVLTFVLFGLSVVAALVHAMHWVHNEHGVDSVDFMSVLVPAAAAGLGGYAAQRDYARLAIRSSAMARVLNRAVDDLQDAQTMDELLRIVQRIEDTLEGESSDWYAAARLREPELP